jgi:hypothetical protein
MHAERSGAQSSATVTPIRVVGFTCSRFVVSWSTAGASAPGQGTLTCVRGLIECASRHTTARRQEMLSSARVTGDDPAASIDGPRSFTFGDMFPTSE